MNAEGNAETRFELVARLAGEAAEAENNLENAILKAGGREFIREGDRWKPVEPVAEREVPLPQTYQLNTLAGLVAYLKADIDKTKDAGAVVHVVSPTDDAHPWGQPQELENFQVWLRARFVPTTDSENLLKALSGVKDGEVKNVVDTGLSQEVSIKVGVDLTETWKLEAILKVVQFLDWSLNKNEEPKPFVVIG